MQPNRIVSREEWLFARKDVLEKEKELTRLRDRVSAARRALPWVKIEKEYVFDGPEGKVTLADLFDGRSQLFVKHFMMGPGRVGQCVGCSLEVDHVEGALVHLQNHDVSYAVVARGSRRLRRGAPTTTIGTVTRGWKISPGTASSSGTTRGQSSTPTRSTPAGPRCFWACTTIST